MAWRIGVDSGGTFTDICLFEEGSGHIAVWKVPSTPADPAQAVVEGVGEALREVAAQAGDVSYFGHGTTVATNALIQHRGASTGLITSDGFRDLLEIGRQRRPDLYDLQADKPPVLVARRLRHEVPERLLHHGHVETALDEAAVRNAVHVLRDARVEAVAICFLYSFLDSTHEQAACRIVSEEFPEAFVCASHEVAPEFREYERLSTTVVNAYLGPIMAFYIRGVCRPADSARRQRDAISDAVERRRDRVRRGGAAAGADGVVGPEHWRRRRPGDRPASRDARPDHLRHGRYLHRCRLDARG
jgi:N-methylhydantoinase A